YLIGFIAVTFFVSVVDVPKPILKDIEYLGKVILTIAMAAIGLKVSFKQLLSAGSRGLRFGGVMFALQLGLLLLMIWLMR
ncbi:MAG: putative sulfate exporter family transporter, partial [Bacteroidota bacterium]